MLKQIFERAKKHGISRGAIGIKVYGRKCYAWIYSIKNPTAKTLDKLNKAVDELIVEKNKKNKK